MWKSRKIKRILVNAPTLALCCEDDLGILEEIICIVCVMHNVGHPHC
jgi:hypothetical protein